MVEAAVWKGMSQIQRHGAENCPVIQEGGEKGRHGVFRR